jgi:hypothetical protein
MGLNKTYSKVHMDKHLSDSFPTQNSLNFQLCLEYAISRSRKPGVTEIKWDTLASDLW